MAQRKRVGKIKELSEIANRASTARTGEPAPGFAQTSAVGVITHSEREVPSDNTPAPSEAASRREPTRQASGTLTGEADDPLLTLRLPTAVILQLEEQARRDNTLLRVVLLRALAAAGYHVGSQIPMRRDRRPDSGYSDLARAIALFSLLSR
jgi:hypothetical protein